MSRKQPPKPARAETKAELQAMSKAELADAYGPLIGPFKRLEKRIEAFKEEFERRKLILLLGATWCVQRSESSFDGVDVPAARAELGATWCEAHKVKIKRVSWTAAALNEADKTEAT